MKNNHERDARYFNIGFLVGLGCFSLIMIFILILIFLH